MEKKLKITNGTQFDSLIKELEKNPSLAKGFSRGCLPSNFKKNWEEISTKLNSLGPPARNSDGWQKVWRDLKFKSRKKVSFNKAECNVTGGGRYQQLQLSPLEEAVANLMKFGSQLTPDGFVCGSKKDQGFSVVDGEEETRVPPACALRSSNVEAEEYAPTNESFTHHQPGSISATEEDWLDERVEDEENICPPESSSGLNSHSKTTKKSQRKQKEHKEIRESLFELHSNMQEKVFNDISRTMNSIKNALKDTKIIQEEKLQLLKKQNENEKEILKIKKEKLKLLRKKREREEELFQNEVEIKKIELEIKKRQLHKLNESDQ